MEGVKHQLDYPADKRPIVLCVPSADSRRTAELNPSMMNPGPRIKQVANHLEEVNAFELKITSEPTSAQMYMCRLIQYTVYWIAEQYGEDDNGNACLNLQLSFFQESKNLWGKWISGEIEYSIFSECLQLKLTQVCDDEDVDIFAGFHEWASSLQQFSNEFRKTCDDIEGQRNEGYQFSAPSRSDMFDVDFTVTYSFDTVSVLSHATEGLDESRSITKEFENDALCLRSMFFDGAIDKTTFDELIFLRFRATCPAASSICILSESEKQALIFVFEIRLRTCASVEVTTELVERAGSCSFCLEEIEVGQDCLQTPCVHTFHAKCLQGILFHHGKCPNCRQSFTRHAD